MAGGIGASGDASVGVGAVRGGTASNAVWEPGEVAVAEVWADGWRGPSVIRVDEDGVSYKRPLDDRAACQAITVLPGFMDWHVHLGLTDARKLVAGGIARVLDLGWIPDEAAKWAGALDDALPDTEIAGALLAPPGGYPTRSTWAPAAATIEIDSPDAAAAAIARMHALGAAVIKITLNSEAGPTFTDAMLSTIVTAARYAGLPVVAHAEGAGQAERAAAAGVDMLAHAPFSQRLDDATLAAMVDKTAWISTLDIHGWGTPTAAFAIASDNVRRFVALGGEVRYGTDLGNGPLPVGINLRELSALATAGLSADALVASIVGPRTSAQLGRRVSVIRGQRPADPTELAHWLTTAAVTGTVTGKARELARDVPQVVHGIVDEVLREGLDRE